MLYWPEFEFDFCLDAQALFPYIAAIEACQEAAACRVVPPAWREQPAPLEVTPPPEQAPGQPLSDRIAARKLQMLARNSFPSWNWVKQRFVPGSPPLTLADIQSMHGMLAEESGLRTNSARDLRTAGVMVGRREAEGIHVGAPPGRLFHLMEQYVEFVNSLELMDLPAAIHSLVAHFFLTAIHPFDDGNGRVSRLVAAGIMFQRGYKGHGLHAMQNHFYLNDTRYHILLQRCFNQPLPFDLTQFVAFGLEGLAMELQGIDTFMKMKLHRTVKMDSVVVERWRKRRRRRAR